MPTPLIIATGNQHKLFEISAILRALLPGITYDLLCAGDFEHIPEPQENGATFEENALIKARAYAGATGILTLADDSGLVIDALDGRPGLYSARYAPSAHERIARVLMEMEGIPRERRTARFICAAALCDAAGTASTRRGAVEGLITASPRGGSGFGYDPIFEITDANAPDNIIGRTLAEIGEAEKNSLSHRGRALAELAPNLREAALAQHSARRGTQL